MILLLGASGYIGQAFTQYLTGRKIPFQTLSRKQLDYARFPVLLDCLRERKPEFLINCAGFTGKPNVDACEAAWADTLQGNTLLPQTIAQACLAADVPWGNISSGCIYSGAKIGAGKTLRPEKDLTRPELMDLANHHREQIHGYTESDQPNFSFRDPPCSFYSGTKALAEEAITGVGRSYLWRLRIPFDEQDNARNYLTKIQRYPKVYDNVNSISHRADFVRACFELWERQAPFGIYNITNPGFVTTRQVVAMIERILKPNRPFDYWADDAEFYRIAGRTPRSNCVLDTAKLLGAGVKIRPVEEALEDSLTRWVKER